MLFDLALVLLLQTICHAVTELPLLAAIRIASNVNIGGGRTSHTSAPAPLLPLLPSRPGGVRSLASRGDRHGHHWTAHCNGFG